MKRKLFYILVLLLMVMQGAWALNQEDGYYMIGSAQDLKDFAALVNSGNTTINGKLIAPINLQGSNENQWTPIGTSSHNYNGTFDGQGFTISNLYYHQVVASSGLFGRAGASARIKNVRVVVDIDNTGNGATTSGGGTEAGGILGTGTSGTVIINCSVAGSVISYSNVGGIVGTGSVTIVNCYNEATVKFFSNTGQVGGGIHGYGGSPTLTNCYNVGQIINTGTATSHMGNIAISGTATNCYSLANSCQNGAGAAWSNKANNGITGTTMTSSEMRAASFMNTLYSNALSLRSTYADIDTWMQDPTTGLPILQNTYKPTEGPWRREEIISGYCSLSANSSISWNGLNNSQWNGSILPYSNDTYGLGTQMAGTSASNSKQAIYSLYSTTQTVPAYSVMVWNWDFWLNNQYPLFAQQTALYAHTDLNTLKNASLDFTVNNESEASSAYLVGIISTGTQNSTTDHNFQFDNRYGSSDKSQPVYMIQTQIMWANQASTGFGTHSVSFKDLGSSYTYYYYKHITFDANGGSGSMSVQQIENSGTLTANAFTRSGYTFAGWNTQADGNGTSYTNEAAITATSSDKGPVTLYAQWTENTATLSQADDNSTFISTNNGLVYDITLTRTLNAGGWNTFCVPFNLDIPSGWTVRELASSAFDVTTKTLTLNFTEASSIEAGKPYLVYLGNSSNVENPTFYDVTIADGTTTTTTTYADFIPVMNPTELTANDKTVLFVTAGNKLTYPNKSANLNGFRAYFQLKEGAAANASAFEMNFDEGETTGISSIENGQWTIDNSEVYNLNGQRVAQPTKGLYIVNGKKIIVK